LSAYSSILMHTEFDALTFDCYGTLIDWEAGVARALAPWLERVRQRPSHDALFASFGRNESAQQAEAPEMRYPEILAATMKRMAAEWNVSCSEEEAAEFGASVGSWPPFPDTPAALARLKQRYRLFVLSNIDRETFRATNASLGVEFDGVFTAQDIGSYKPDPRNFDYLIARLAERGIDRSRVLHVAQSIFHDHVPASRAGLATAWIVRGHEHDGRGGPIDAIEDLRLDYRFDTLGELATEL
jgi:2-haloacid dehalogenase